MLSYIEQNESWRVNRMSQTAGIRAWGKDRDWLNRPVGLVTWQYETEKGEG